MTKGRQTRILRKDQIERLETFRRARHDGAEYGYSFPQLRLAMGKPCGWETIQKALAGNPIWDLVAYRLQEWIERYLPAGKAVHDGKAAAAGEKQNEEDPKCGATGITDRHPGGK